MNSGPLKKVLEVAVAQILKQQGFSSANRRAISLLGNTMFNYLVYNSAILKKQCESARRSSPTLIDAVPLLEMIKEVFTSQGSISVEIEEEKKEEDTPSEISMQIDHPPNCYDFLPKYPPAHTFKNTPIKRRISDDRAQKARLRNEQTIKVVDSLFEIYKRKKRSFSHANYLMDKL
ncbi:transcription initiation factor TFIID subunit 8 [Nematocida sp. LUAm3]|nr:transcription initiation factor TFIID subunit 8 [Nematocida sp. LUAm3]KAI5173598.1 transcription initiation factor TFIID subunit 8 [Nematocida sp. LUAm2]KAI5176819.1 transcription initiation factor TFIID subunit 8 [Nematocida sp. LUAm1]